MKTRSGLVYAIVVFSSLFFNQQSFACGCVWTDGMPSKPAEFFKASDIVIKGEVLRRKNISKYHPPVVVGKETTEGYYEADDWDSLVKVTKVYKGDDLPTYVNVRTEEYMCQSPLPLGKELLLYINPKGQLYLKMDPCDFAFYRVDKEFNEHIAWLNKNAK